MVRFIDPDQIHWLEEIIRDARDRAEDPEEARHITTDLLMFIQRQRLQAVDDPDTRDGNIIDRLAAILSLGYGRSVFGKDVLKRLERLILREDELQQLDDVIISCARCGRALHSHEVVSIADSRRCEILCAGCSDRFLVGCPRCGKPHPVSDSITNSLIRTGRGERWSGTPPPATGTGEDGPDLTRLADPA